MSHRSPGFSSLLSHSGDGVSIVKTVEGRDSGVEGLSVVRLRRIAK